MHEEEVTTYSVDDGITKKEVINSSRRCWLLLAETAKLNLEGNYVFADLEELTGYIFEKKLDLEDEKKLEEKGLEII